MIELEIVEIPVQPSKAGELEKAIIDRRSDYFRPPHCMGLTVGRSQADDQVVACVIWASREAHAAAQSDEGAQKLFDAVARLAAGSAAIRVFSRAQTFSRASADP